MRLKTVLILLLRRNVSFMESQEIKIMANPAQPKILSDWRECGVLIRSLNRLEDSSKAIIVVCTRTSIGNYLKFASTRTLFYSCTISRFSLATSPILLQSSL